jgi:hypothetical protein
MFDHGFIFAWWKYLTRWNWCCMVWPGGTVRPCPYLSGDDPWYGKALELTSVQHFEDQEKVSRIKRYEENSKSIEEKRALGRPVPLLGRLPPHSPSGFRLAPRQSLFSAYSGRDRAPRTGTVLYGPAHLARTVCFSRFFMCFNRFFRFSLVFFRFPGFSDFCQFC